MTATFQEDGEYNPAADSMRAKSSGKTPTSKGRKGRSRPKLAQSTSSDGEDKRKRVPIACVRCRSRKIRCDGEQPSCGHCSVDPRAVCVYTKVTAEENELAKTKKKQAAINRAAFGGMSEVQTKRPRRSKVSLGEGDVGFSHSGASSPYARQIEVPSARSSFLQYQLPNPNSSRRDWDGQDWTRDEQNSAWPTRDNRYTAYEQRWSSQHWSRPMTAESSTGEGDFDEHSRRTSASRLFSSQSPGEGADSPAMSAPSETGPSPGLRVIVPPPSFGNVSSQLASFQMYSPEAREDRRVYELAKYNDNGPRSAPLTRPPLPHMHSYHPSSGPGYAPDIGHWALAVSGAHPASDGYAQDQRYLAMPAYDRPQLMRSPTSFDVGLPSVRQMAPVGFPSYDEFHNARSYYAQQGGFDEGLSFEYSPATEASEPFFESDGSPYPAQSPALQLPSGLPSFHRT